MSTPTGSVSTSTAKTPVSADAQECNGSDLTATFTRVRYGGQATGASYRLVLRNSGAGVCAISIMQPQLLSASGKSLPTSGTVVGSDNLDHPFMMSPGQTASSTASFALEAGNGEPSSGPCQPTATKLLLEPGNGLTTAGAVTVAISPPTPVCEMGSLAWSGDLQRGSNSPSNPQ